MNEVTSVQCLHEASLILFSVEYHCALRPCKRRHIRHIYRSAVVGNRLSHETMAFLHLVKTMLKAKLEWPLQVQAWAVNESLTTNQNLLMKTLVHGQRRVDMESWV